MCNSENDTRWRSTAFLGRLHVKGASKTDAKPKINLLNRALIENSAGTPTLRILDSTLEILMPGIAKRNLPDGPSYLVFATSSYDPADSTYSVKDYDLMTDAGIVRVLDDGALGGGLGSPMDSAIVSEASDFVPVNVFSLADIRAVVQTNELEADKSSDQRQNNVEKNLNQDTPTSTIVVSD